MQTTRIHLHNDAGEYSHRVLFGLAVVTVGTLALLTKLDLISLPPLRTLWPVFIIAAGLSILLRRSQSAVPVPGDRIDIDAGFSNLRQRSESQRFQGGRVELKYSGLMLDLTTARMDADEVVLDVDTRFSNIELRVPRDWQVVDDVASVVGGVTNRTASNVLPTKRLVLRGRARFGNILVRH